MVGQCEKAIGSGVEHVGGSFKIGSSDRWQELNRRPAPVSILAFSFSEIRRKAGAVIMAHHVGARSTAIDKSERLT
jgi:hypothetical protein